MIRKLAHLCLVTEQMETLVRFYTEQLGLSVQFLFRHDDGGVFGYYLGAGDTTFIEIFDNAGRAKQWGGGKPQPMAKGNYMQHMCFEVTGLRDLKTLLESRGMKITDIRTGMDQSMQAWTNDPDGNAIELIEYTHASWELRAPERLKK